MGRAPDSHPPALSRSGASVRPSGEVLPGPGDKREMTPTPACTLCPRFRKLKTRNGPQSHWACPVSGASGPSSPQDGVQPLPAPMNCSHVTNKDLYSSKAGLQLLQNATDDPWIRPDPGAHLRVGPLCLSPGRPLPRSAARGAPSHPLPSPPRTPPPRSPARCPRALPRLRCALRSHTRHPARALPSAGCRGGPGEEPGRVSAAAAPSSQFLARSGGTRVMTSQTPAGGPAPGPRSLPPGYQCSPTRLCTIPLRQPRCSHI